VAESNRMPAATYTQGGAFSIEDVPMPQIESEEILTASTGTASRMTLSFSRNSTNNPFYPTAGSRG